MTAPDIRTADIRTADVRATDIRLPGVRVAGGRVPEARTPDGRTPGRAALPAQGRPHGIPVPTPHDRFRILFVCTGNICRSPIAERLTRHGIAARLGGRGAGQIVVESAGTWGHEGAPMEAHAATVLGEYGADPAGFAGRELLDEHVIDADLVLTATLDHRAQVISMGHAAGLRTFTLKEFTRLVRTIDPATLPDPLQGAAVAARARALVRAAAALRGWLLASTPEADEVDDPYGAPISMFRNCGEEIYHAIDPVVTALTGVALP